MAGSSWAVHRSIVKPLVCPFPTPAASRRACARPRRRGMTRSWAWWRPASELWICPRLVQGGGKGWRQSKAHRLASERAVAGGQSWMHIGKQGRHTRACVSLLLQEEAGEPAGDGEERCRAPPQNQQGKRQLSPACHAHTAMPTANCRPPASLCGQVIEGRRMGQSHTACTALLVCRISLATLKAHASTVSRAACT